MILERNRCYGVTIQGKSAPVTVRLQYRETAYHLYTNAVLLVFRNEALQEESIPVDAILEIKHTIPIGDNNWDVNDPECFKPFPTEDNL